MSDHQFVFCSQVDGIPCQIGVIEYVRGSYDYNAASDFDYYGTCSWEVLDRKGYKANWLEKKLKDEDYSRIERELEEYVAEMKSRW